MHRACTVRACTTHRGQGHHAAQLATSQHSHHGIARQALLTARRGTSALLTPQHAWMVALTRPCKTPAICAA